MRRRAISTRRAAAAALVAVALGGLLAAGLAAPAQAATAPAVTLLSSANPSVFSQRVVLTAVATVPGTPSASVSGTMTFSDAASVLGTATVTSGRATLATTTLAVGSHALTATFADAAGSPPVTSPALMQVVDTANTTTTIASSRPTANYGDAGSITATVKAVAPATGVPTGTVDFHVDGGWYWNAPLNAKGRATMALTDLYPAFNPGTYTITAVYSGDTGFNPSTTATGISQTLVGTTTPPVSTVTLNTAGKPTFAPSSFTLSSYSPVGCNVTITNSTPSTLVLLYGMPGAWKRLPFGGNIALGASGGIGVGLPSYTGYFTAMGASNYVTLRCR